MIGHYETRHFFPFQSLNFSFYDWVGVSQVEVVFSARLTISGGHIHFLVNVCARLLLSQVMTETPLRLRRTICPYKLTLTYFSLKPQNVFFLPKLFSPLTHRTATSQARLWWVFWDFIFESVLKPLLSKSSSGKHTEDTHTMNHRQAESVQQLQEEWHADQRKAATHEASA